MDFIYFVKNIKSSNLDNRGLSLYYNGASYPNIAI